MYIKNSLVTMTNVTFARNIREGIYCDDSQISRNSVTFSETFGNDMTCVGSQCLIRNEDICVCIESCVDSESVSNLDAPLLTQFWIIVIGAGGGGFLLLLIVGISVGVCVSKRRKRNKSKKLENTSESSVELRNDYSIKYKPMPGEPPEILSVSQKSQLSQDEKYDIQSSEFKVLNQVGKGAFGGTY